MRDEPKNFHHQPPWRPEMPHISIPIQTITNNVRPGVQSPSVTTVSLPGTTGFALGVDTCGFTSSSTITCDYGYECNNVGSYRGCCLPDDDGCASTIYTDCVDYTDIGYSMDCGIHTLCCPETNPYCFTYAFMTDGEPGATLTHVQCNPSNGFGEMFPFPPELMTTTSAPPSETSSSDDDSYSHSTPTGAIVGAVVGSVVFVILVIIAAALLFRRRSRRRAALSEQAAQSGPAKAPQSSADVSPSSEKEHAQAAAAAAATHKKRNRRSLLRPLSLIREQPSPVSPTHEKHKTVAAAGPTAARRTFGPDWPLGPSASNPLGAHPIDADLKKRLSDSRIGTRVQPDRVPPQQRVPVLQLRTPPPPPGTKPAPLPLARRSSRGSGSGSGATLQSPRLSYVPVSPIEVVAFGDGADRRVSRALEQISRSGSARSNATTGRPRSSGVAPQEPVSPIESDADGDGAERGGDVDGDAQQQHRLSYVSAPSAPGDADRDLVSPVSYEAGSDPGEGRGESRAHQSA
ncbi:hypothetical protein F4818DRAFT_167262 [Hypoxylon cercidicola]|nr:hypothetical protein F4818DRAFT_167262 [Hypoxylon cercidicola]